MPFVTCNLIFRTFFRTVLEGNIYREYSCLIREASPTQGFILATPLARDSDLCRIHELRTSPTSVGGGEATGLTNVLRSVEDDSADCSPAFPAVVPVRLHTAWIDGS